MAGRAHPRAHVPRSFLESRVGTAVPDKNAEVVLYCAAGNRSAFAAKSLEDLGYTHVHSLIGGCTDWKRNGLEITVPRVLSPERRTRYSRHTLIPEIGEEGQLRLLDSRVLLIGAGDLSSPASLYLAAAGVSTLGIVDADIVDETNLQRQIVHSLNTLGEPVDSASASGAQPGVEVRTYRERLTSEGIDRILADGWDVIVDGADNFRRYLVNDASVWRHPSRARLDLSLRGARSPSSSRRTAPATAASSRAAAARAGAVVLRGGVLGAAGDRKLAADERGAEARARDRRPVGRLLLFDALETDFTEVRIERRHDCPVCGDHPTITEYIDYVEFCQAGAAPGVVRVPRCFVQRRAARARSGFRHDGARAAQGTARVRRSAAGVRRRRIRPFVNVYVDGEDVRTREGLNAGTRRRNGDRTGHGRWLLTRST